ncbi:MAG: hypothetical protein NXI10_13545 [bacterium]|nr:hypothetical protein [bacterium]
MKVCITFVLLGFVLLSCGDSKNLDESLVDISKFKMDDSALEDGEDVRILGASGNLTSDDEMDFYNLIVVESLETGKTVNVLMPTYIFVDEYSRELQFYSFKTTFGRIVGSTGSKGLDKNVEKKVNLKDIQPPKFDKVLYDKEFIQTNVYNNPTIIGTLGKITTYQKDPNNLEEETEAPVVDVIDSLSKL